MHNSVFKVFLTCYLFICSGSTLYAQYQNSMGFVISYDAVKAFPLRKSSTADIPNYYRSGFSLKIPLKIDMTEYIKLRTALQYSKAGSNVYNKSYSVNYVRVPLDIRFDIIQDWNCTLYCFAGPYAGYNISSKATMINGRNIPISKLDFGGNAGGGVELPLNDSINISFELSYLLGIKDIYTEQDYRILTNTNWSVGTGIHYIF